MRPTRKPRLIFLAGAVGCSLAMGAGAQEADEPPPSPSPFEEQSSASIEAEVGALLDAFDLTPKPVPEIPDNPPPHEGAMIDQPEYRVEPPDLLLVEVIEALPGRPISGERLIRPDGTISLGFYGDIHVRGLTVEQVKVKIIKQLRTFLTDEVLGIAELVDCPPPANEAEEAQGGIEVSPDGTIKKIEGAEKPGAPQAITIQAGEGVSIRIEVKKQGEPNPDEPPMGWANDPFGPTVWRPSSPELSDRVFVDVTAYNSKNYYVLGDVQSPGKLPHTGNETVLDALQYGGGLTGTGDPGNIKLVRPGRDGKPGKVYQVDLAGIRDRGETATNYQIFPGDRLVVGREKIVEQTIKIDRLAAPIQTVLQSVLQNSATASGLRSGFQDQAPEALKTIVEFWIREMNRPGGAVLDEQILRDALIRGLPVAPAKPKEAKDGD